MMFNGDDCTPPWKSRLVSLRKSHLAGKSTFDASHETRKPRASTESWGRVNSLGHLGRTLEVSGFHLAPATGDVEFRGLLRPKSQPSHHAQRREVPDAALHAILSHAVGGVGTSRWGHGTVTPRLSCSPCCVTGFLWIALCCMGSKAKKILSLWQQTSGFYKKKHGGSAPKMEI